MDDPRKRLPGCGAGFGLVAVCVAFYVLSVGPAIVLRDRDYVSQESVSTIYTPLVWLCDRCTPLRNPLKWHARKWTS